MISQNTHTYSNCRRFHVNLHTEVCMHCTRHREKHFAKQKVLYQNATQRNAFIQRVGIPRSSC